MFITARVVTTVSWPGRCVGCISASDRFLWIGGGHFWLSEEPDEPGSYGWDAAYPRIASWVRLRDKQSDRVMVVVNTHFDHRGDEARLNSAKLIREKLKDIANGDPVVLMGDFNCTEDDDPYQQIIAPDEDGTGALVDAYRAVHPERTDSERTYHGFRGKVQGSRIDWILHSTGITALDAGIDHAHEGLKYPSDHYPVTATLQLSPLNTPDQASD